MGRVGGSEPKSALLLDADVVIDYQHSDLTVVSLIAKHLGPLAVITAVIDEVDGLARKDFLELGVEVLSPTTAQWQRARDLDSGANFTDRMCLVVAGDEGRICVTNDRTLRNLCLRLGVRTRFGLGLMVDLVGVGAMTRQHAEQVATKIRDTNPYITGRVLRRFLFALHEAPQPTPPTGLV